MLLTVEVCQRPPPPRGLPASTAEDTNNDSHPRSDGHSFPLRLYFTPLIKSHALLAVGMVTTGALVMAVGACDEAALDGGLQWGARQILGGGPLQGLTADSDWPPAIPSLVVVVESLVLQ
ncbi:hypothetical protein Tsubulata_005379 [Turnera subulata]|uniref:Uncharacterized protein n=1 Tax=Turnera subulata TaxID=218843 RepID=A0A9Q0G5W9_9ROSI|nr:hypothetical protein Tsubulata_005379 [Turnera subulata]